METLIDGNKGNLGRHDTHNGKGWPIITVICWVWQLWTDHLVNENTRIYPVTKQQYLSIT